MKETSKTWVCIGVDVGGTNTDAVIVANNAVLPHPAKVPTTGDITSGVIEAIRAALAQLPGEFQPNPAQYVSRVNIGTTHFLNAIVQKKGLVNVAVLRLCGPATTAIPPLGDFPADLKDVIGGMHFFLNGGNQYDGSCITDVDEEEVKRTIKEVYKSGIKNVAIVGVFSPAYREQEAQVADIIKSECPDISVTLSHEVGLIGLLERENAAVLNESLKPLCYRTVKAFRAALNKLDLKCPLYLTQNDGTIISAERIRQLPVYAIASGPTNSMRGAGFLLRVQDAVVIDIGGTTTDVGVIKGGFPRQASTRVKIGGVNTNFRMPDVLSVGLGGGSKVRQEKGKTMTSTDIAVASDFCNNIGDEQRVKHIPEDIRIGALKEIKRKIESAVDRVKFSAEDQLVILVGGGSILVNPKLERSGTFKGASDVFRPTYYEAANAVGAALSKVSGTFDQVISMVNTTRAIELEKAERGAREKAVEAGADEQTLEVVDVMEVPLTYLSGNAVRYYVKVVGDLAEPGEDISEEVAEPGKTKP